MKRAEGTYKWTKKLETKVARLGFVCTMVWHGVRVVEVVLLLSSSCCCGGGVGNAAAVVVWVLVLVHRAGDE